MFEPGLVHLVLLICTSVSSLTWGSLNTEACFSGSCLSPAVWTPAAVLPPLVLCGFMAVLKGTPELHLRSTVGVDSETQGTRNVECTLPGCADAYRQEQRGHQRGAVTALTCPGISGVQEQRSCGITITA